MKRKIAVLLLGFVCLAATSVFAGSENPVVGGQEIPNRGKNFVLKDEKGGVSTVTIPNVFSVEWRDSRG